MRTEAIENKNMLARLWVLSFIIASFIFVVLFVAFLWIERTNLPAPAFSNNISLNAKIRWARDKIQASQCETLILGSSMALNNIDGAIVKERYSGSVLNLGAWSLNIEDDDHLLAVLIRYCKPKRILMPIYYGDFRTSGSYNDFKLEQLNRYLSDKSGHDLIYHLNGSSIFNFLNDYIDAIQFRHLNGTLYTSLEFDETGGAPLACHNFKRDNGRWTGYLKSPIVDPSGEINEFKKLVHFIENEGIDLIVAETPMRSVARDAFGDKLNLWRNAIIEAVQISSAQFIPAPKEMGDESFADYAHLNGCGAGDWTRYLMNTIRK